MATYFPLGTSRLHETLEARPEVASFPGFGYFHSSSQMWDILQVLDGARHLSVDAARYFFRKDQTPSNPFDTRVWTAELTDALAAATSAFEAADHVLIEISSLRTYRWHDLHVQGNPNYYRNAPYSEVWREGYYARYDPDAGVEVFDDITSINANVRAIATLLRSKGKLLTLLGHLIDPRNPNATRVTNNRAVADAAEANGDLGVRFFDTSPYVREYGFRVLPDGSTDIHHLPDSAYPVLVAELAPH